MTMDENPPARGDTNDASSRTLDGELSPGRRCAAERWSCGASRSCSMLSRASWCSKSISRALSLSRRVLGVGSRPRAEVMRLPQPVWMTLGRHAGRRVAAAVAIALLPGRCRQPPTPRTRPRGWPRSAPHAACAMPDSGQALQIGTRLRAHARILTDDSGSAPARHHSAGPDRHSRRQHKVTGTLIQVTFSRSSEGSIAISAAHRALARGHARAGPRGRSERDRNALLPRGWDLARQSSLVQEGRVLVLAHTRWSGGGAGDGRIPVGGGRRSHGAVAAADPGGRVLLVGSMRRTPIWPDLPLLGPGDLVELTAGVWREAATIHVEGASGNPVRILANTGASARWLQAWMQAAGRDRAA